MINCVKIKSILAAFAISILLFSGISIAHAAITVDGRLLETEWVSAQTFTDFTITSPLSLKQPEYQTVVKILTDSNGIYIGITNHQPESMQQKATHLRDGDGQADYNEIIIDFEAIGLTAYGFRIGSGNSIQDAVWTDENRKETDWDGDWTYATDHDEQHWYSEIFIPWSVVPMQRSTQEARLIGIYIARKVHNLDKIFAFPGVDASQKTFISAFHRFEVKTGRVGGVDIFPYVALNHDAVADKNDADAGIDIFWKPNESNRLNMAIRPDFGQVETDELVVNFSAIESFFSEKRPFFIEDQALFDLRGPENMRIVHTPRIGGPPDAGDETSTDIVGALRYTFKGDWLNAGVLTASEDDSDLAKGRDYVAGRLRVQQGDYNVGYTFTHTNRSTLDRNALVQVIDYRYDLHEQLQWTGQVISTRIEQADQTIPDYGAWTTFEYQPKEYWLHSLSLIRYGDNMDISDLGFIKRVDRKQLEYETEYQIGEFPTNRFVRDLTWGLGLEYRRTQAGAKLPTNVSATIETTFTDTSTISAETEHSSEGIDDLITRGNGNVELPQRLNTTITYGSDQRPKFRYELEFTRGQEGIDGYFSEISFSPSYQFTDQVGLESEFSYASSDEWLIWLDGIKLATFKRREVSASLSLNATLGRRHEFRYKLEAIGLKAKALQGYDATPDERLQPNADTVEDFELSEFATQFRYRYRLGPLTDVFIVYSRGGEFEANSISRGFSEIIDESIDIPTGENYLIKIRFQL